MQDDVIDDVVVETIILQAVNGDEEARTALIESAWLGKVLNAVSIWSAARFKSAKLKGDPDEIRQIVWLKVFLYIHTLKNPKKKTWCSCLRTWCYAVARNYCLNEIRHSDIVLDHDKTVSQENDNGTIKTASGRKRPIPNSVERSAEEISNENAENTLWQCREDEVRRRIWDVLNSFPSEKRTIGLFSLRERKSVREIVALTNTPVSTTYDILSKIQKALVAELGIEQDVADDPKLAVALDSLIEKCLRAMPNDRPRR